jgi:hypothetical protein
MFTSIASFGVGYFITRHSKPFASRLAVAIGCFAIAWVCHAFWNSPFAESNIFMLVLRGTPILVVGALLWWLAGRDEGGTLLAIADHYVPGANPRTELAAIEVRLLRDRYERAAGITAPVAEEAP